MLRHTYAFKFVGHAPGSKFFIHVRTHTAIQASETTVLHDNYLIAGHPALARKYSAIILWLVLETILGPLERASLRRSPHPRCGNDDGTSRTAAPALRADGAGSGPNPGAITTSPEPERCHLAGPVGSIWGHDWATSDLPAR